MLVTSLAGCKPTENESASILAGGAPATALIPRAASRFVCRDSECRQAHPRLPDTGEWRCAERAQVVWCTGGEPAAGVVSGPADVRFRCGPRWGQAAAERVCIDEQPDYPEERADYTRCSFDQERGMARVCGAKESLEPAPPARGAVPACWLDRDCPSARCDRGACTCSSHSDCQVGSCRRGICSEGVQ